MPLYAVALAGIPGTIINEVRAELRQRFSDRHAFRAAGAPERSSKLTLYDNKVISASGEMAADVVFGKTSKPWGFCKGDTKPCALREGGNKSCLRTPEQTCAMERPDHLVLIYQQGDNEDALLKEMHFAPIALRIPRECYGKKIATIENIIALLGDVEKIAGDLRDALRTHSSPLFLPPINFGSKNLDQLLNDAMKGLASDKDRRQFKQNNTVNRNGAKSYRGRSKLCFTPCEGQQQHGDGGNQLAFNLALTKIYRLGCVYDDEFHYDVTRLDEKHFDGKTAFTCRRGGIQHPTGKENVNVYVDDCLR